MISIHSIFRSLNNDYVIYKDERFFLYRMENKQYLVSDKCPHRGGPLSLGVRCEKSGEIECPWHSNVIPAVTLKKRSISGVRVGATVYII